MITPRASVLVTGCMSQSLHFYHLAGVKRVCVNSLVKDKGLLRNINPCSLVLSHFVSSDSSKESSSSITEARSSEQAQLTLGEKVKRTTKDASYLGVIIAGLGVTGLMFYAIFRELFSGQSPNSVYTEALKKCRSDGRITSLIGEPVQGYGETTTRGRRRHVSHMEYLKDGTNFMRMKFYIKGPMRSGTVHLEVKQNSNKKYDYRYLFVDLDGHPKQTVVLEDNRTDSM